MGRRRSLVLKYARHHFLWQAIRKKNTNEQRWRRMRSVPLVSTILVRLNANSGEFLWANNGKTSIDLRLYKLLQWISLWINIFIVNHYCFWISIFLISYKMRDSVANAGLTYISLYHFLSKTDVHNFDQGKFLINFKVSWGWGVSTDHSSDLPLLSWYDIFGHINYN